MAQRQYDVTRGSESAFQVTEGAGSSIGGAAVRVIVDDGNAATLIETLEALEAVKHRLQTEVWPPA